jgi:hypothetical protein
MRKLFLACIAIAMIACGGKNGGGGGDDAGTGGDGGGDGTGGDGPGGMCTAGSAQCNDCVDNDADGKIDGFDPECTGPLDNDESSFATGIPGDNIDPVQQDCFFDGNSGAGNDGCNQHVCCLLGAMSKAECTTLVTGIVNNPQTVGNNYNKDECFAPLGSVAVPQQCKDVCGPITPPGCDCFGCCTECDDQGCVDIVLNPAVSPDCDSTTIHDDTKCKPCTKVADCGGGNCGGSTCILCPGQDPSDLPDTCNTPTCPIGTMPCDAAGQCPEGTYCSTGCCIGIIQ